MSSNYDDTPLPDGWIREFDPKSKHPFWVDTQAKPPRSIWVHPFEDEQFLAEHPDIRDRLAAERPSEQPPPYTPRRHSFSGSSASGSRLVPPARSDAIGTSYSHPGTPVAGQSQHSRGFFGKLKDKAIGTKEEREARRRAEDEENKRYLAELQKRRQQRAQMSPSLGSYSRYPQYGGSSSYGQSYGGGYSQPMYAAPAGSPFGLGGRRTGFGGGGFGGGGIGLPLFAGAAGGLLLGDMLGGGFGGGGFDGGFGGGGFDNGFGGGGFDNNFGGGGFF
ncbi:hypothetical protein BD309DRAFT_912499 [Dichomitus squalens]|nr:hypothetical protein BD309DRAFT_912499 [Dichomitus squalens]